MASTISAGTTSGTALNIQSDTTGNLAFKTGSANVTAMTLDSNQNVAFANGVSFTTAIGVASGGTGLTSSGSSGNVLTSNGTAWVSSAPAAATSIASGTSNVAVVSSGGNVTIATNGTQAMLVDTSQNVGIGTASPGYALDVRSASAPAIRLSRNGTAGQIASVVFEDGNATLGSGSTTRIASDSGAMYFSTGGTSGAITGGTEQARITSAGLMQFNSGYGSVTTAYGCRAWVNFDGSNGAIRGSGNVGSVTRNSTGNYTVNFTTAMPDTNYSVGGSCMRSSDNTGGTAAGLLLTIIGSATYSTGFTTSSIRVLSKLDNNGNEDGLAVCVNIYR